MSTSASTKEPKVNTFITSAAVIKFSGGSVGTDEWTDSDDEERPEPDLRDIQKSSSQNEKESHADGSERTLNCDDGGAKDGRSIANGKVNHHGSSEKSIFSRFRSPKKSADRTLQQQQKKTDSNSSLHRQDKLREVKGRQKTSMKEGLSLSSSPVPEVEGFEVIPRGEPRTYSDAQSPFNTDVGRREKNGPNDGPVKDDRLRAHAGKPSHANDDADDDDEDKLDQYFSFETDTDISLPLEDQDLALITDEDLGLTENHFSQPEGFFGFSKIEELELAIENCKEAVKSSPEHSENRRMLVAKLVQLRLKLMQIKEGDEDEGKEKEEVKAVLGHRFHRMTGKSLNDHCEVCLSVIWALLQRWYKCSECNFGCHRKCLNLVKRQCVGAKISRVCFDLSICPEKGLSSQNYRCAECRAPLAFNGVQPEPRLCDYSGLYYCSLCHWNDLEVIPARVIHNWDFEPRKVCRQSKQLLSLMSSRAVLRIQDLNPMLFSYVEELSQIRKLRGEILVMKVYFLSCRNAMENKLLKQLQNRPHFVENSDVYSLQDLIDIEEGTLLSELASVHGDYAVHIRIDCQLCKARGFICELCNSSEVLFPFDMIATVCAKCSAVYHRDCYYKRSSECPKCNRLTLRTSTDRPVSSPARPITK